MSSNQPKRNALCGSARIPTCDLDTLTEEMLRRIESADVQSALRNVLEMHRAAG